jgi:hypothetical protein
LWINQHLHGIVFGVWIGLSILSREKCSSSSEDWAIFPLPMLHNVQSLFIFRHVKWGMIISETFILGSSLFQIESSMFYKTYKCTCSHVQVPWYMKVYLSLYQLNRVVTCFLFYVIFKLLFTLTIAFQVCIFPAR